MLVCWTGMRFTCAATTLHPVCMTLSDRSSALHHALLHCKVIYNPSQDVAMCCITCVTVSCIPAATARSHPQTISNRMCVYREAQLALWFQYSAALNATAVSHTLHSKLGRKPASIQLAAALSLPSSAAVARLLAEGKVSLVKFAVSETS